MVTTPWGSSDSLRERMLRPGPATPPEQVAQNQRERLFGAMVASVYERGYRATRVADLTKISGVSSRAFYDLFPDKETCFVAAIEAMIGAAVAYAAKANEKGDRLEASWEEQARGGFDAFAEMIAAQPAAARMCLLEAYTAGPAALKPLDEAVAGFEWLTRQEIARSPERAEMPAEMISAHVGSIQEIARRLLYEDEEALLPELVPDLVRLMLSYRPPPEPLRLSTRLPSFGPESLEAHDNTERVIRAFAMIVAGSGLDKVTVHDLVERAAMSPTTFYANFAGKDDVLGAAIDSACAQIVTAATAPFRRADDWPEAIRAAFGSILGFLASRPALAHLIGVGVYDAGPAAIARRLQGLRPLRALFIEGRRRAPDMPAISIEAIAGGIATLVYRQIREGGAASLPTLAPLCTYIALSPFVGPERACAAANGDGQVRGSRADLDSIREFTVQPTKWSVLMRLSHEAVDAEALAGELEIPVENVRRHLDELEAADLIEPVVAGGAGERRYRAGLRELTDEEWEQLSPPERERISEMVGELIWTEVREARESGSFDARPDRHLSRMSTPVDEQGWRELLDIHNNALWASLRVKAESEERLKRSGEKPINGRSVQTLFELPDPDA
ncbi:MAG TPA: TetR family transcriptional regulator [Solirubrobacterales bacterium]|nr:TetR family transcriptional regulator [Solirubrobacterales bacterium]